MCPWDVLRVALEIIEIESSPCSTQHLLASYKVPVRDVKKGFQTNGSELTRMRFQSNPHPIATSGRVSFKLQSTCGSVEEKLPWVYSTPLPQHRFLSTKPCSSIISKFRVKTRLGSHMFISGTSTMQVMHSPYSSLSTSSQALPFRCYWFHFRGHPRDIRPSPSKDIPSEAVQETSHLLRLAMVASPFTHGDACFFSLVRDQ